MEPREKAEYIVEIIRPCLKRTRNPDWATPRYVTAWGDKTDEGLVESIKRILVSSREGLPKLGIRSSLGTEL